MLRTPPSTGRFTDNDIAVYAFEKSEGEKSSTFVGRIIRRVPIRLHLRDGRTISAVRYAGRYWPIYPAESFDEHSPKWVKAGDTLYGHDYAPLKLPLEHAYLFDCDAPSGHYW